MKLLLFPLLFDLLILSEQLFTIIVVIIIRWVWMYTFFSLLLFTVIFNELFRISIFRERIITQIYCAFLFVGLDFFGYTRLVVSNKIYIITVNIFIFSISYLLLLDDLDLPIFLSSHLCFSLQQLSFEVPLFQFIKRSLPDFSLLQFQITWQILHDLNCTLAEYERVGT